MWFFRVSQWLHSRKFKRYGVRPATENDLDFILNEIHESAAEGHYRDTLLQPEQLHGWRTQLGNVIKFSHLVRYADQRGTLETIRAKLWVYGTGSDDRIGHMLVSERFPGTADSELELYQVGVRNDRRGEGHGRRLVELFVGCAAPSVALYARCLNASDAMVHLLVNADFELIGTTERGTRELVRRSKA